MSIIQRVLPWGTQPPGSRRLNRSHPLGALLDRVWLCSTYNGRDSQSGVYAGIPSSGTINSRYGRGPGIVAATSVAGTAAPIPESTDAYPIILFGYGYYTSSAGNYILAQINNSGGGNITSIRLGSSTTIQVLVQAAFGSARTAAATLSTTLNTPILAIAQIFSATDYRIYANGVMNSGSVSVGAGLELNQVTPPGGTLVGGMWATGNAVAARGFLPDDTALEITRNHSRIWEMWEAPRIWVPVSNAAGGSHATSGDLAAQASTVAGTAAHLTLHPTSGALTAQASAIAGAAAHLTLHATSGALAAAASTIAGTALHPHTSTGALTAQSVVIAGAAEHSAPGTHTTSGALTAQPSALAGTASHLSLHPTSGALAAQSSSLAGTATLISIAPVIHLGNLGWDDRRPQKLRKRWSEIEGLREELAAALDEGKPPSAPRSTPETLRLPPEPSEELKTAVAKVRRRAQDGSVTAQIQTLREAIAVAEADSRRRTRRRRQQVQLLLM